MTTTTVRFPALASPPDGSALTIDLLVELIGANGRALVGAVTPDGAAVTCRAAAILHYDAEADPPSTAVDLDLTPQDQIASPDGRATWYRVTEEASSGAVSVWLVQVPTTDEVIPFGDLLAGAAVAPADLTAGRLLPVDATDGQSLVWSDAAGRWVPTSVAPGIGEAPLTGGPYGRQAGEWTAVGTAAQGALADTAMQPLIYDPAGVRTNVFDISNLTGAVDGGTF